MRRTSIASERLARVSRRARAQTRRPDYRKLDAYLLGDGDAAEPLRLGERHPDGDFRSMTCAGQESGTGDLARVNILREVEVPRRKANMNFVARLSTERRRAFMKRQCG